MSLYLYMSFLLLAIIQPITAQTFIQSGQIGEFRSANSISVNPAGFIYVSDAGSNEIIKLDSLGKIIKSIGGYGWSESSFDHPSDVFSNTLNVYVADKNNNRIQFFDKDLNYLSQISTQNSDDDNIKFRYPLCTAISNQGDLFILDSDNNRILKFNSRFDFQAAIGGYDAGTFSLVNPKQFTIADSKLLVLDSGSLVIYDLYGNGIGKIKLQFPAENINSLFGKVCLNNKLQIAFLDGIESEEITISPATFISKPEEEIIDAVFFNGKLYLLTKNYISIYKKISND